MAPAPEVRQEHSEEDEEVDVGDKYRLLALEVLAVEEPHHQAEEAGPQEDGCWYEERDEPLPHLTDGAHGVGLHPLEREGGEAGEDD